MIPVDIEKFKSWLQENGADILPPTNQYELIRFRGKEVGVIYTSGKTSNSYCNQAILAFLRKRKWNGAPLTTIRKSNYGKEKVALLKRDGDCCFYCGEKLNDDISLEHLIPLTAGGKNILSNMVLVHKECNLQQGFKPLNEKVKYAIKNRKK